MSSAALARDAAIDRPQGSVTRSRRRLTPKRLALAGAAVAILAAAGWYGREWWTNRPLHRNHRRRLRRRQRHRPRAACQRLHRRGRWSTDNQRVQRRSGAGPAGPARLPGRPRPCRCGRQRPQASLQALRAQYLLQQSTIRQQEADLSAKSAQFAFAAQDAERYRSLALTSAGSRQDAQRSASLNEQARSSVLAAAATLEAGRQQLKVLEAQTAEAEANLAQSRSDLQTAQLNLGYTEIRAPIDGYVGNRAAQVGAYAMAGAYLVSIIPDSGLWVDANFKEDQLTHMTDGDVASVVADVLPGHVFHGHVASLAPGTGAVFSVIPAENATGNFTKIVQRVPVRIVLDAGELLCACSARAFPPPRASIPAPTQAGTETQP